MAETAKTKEPQYQICLDYRDERGLERFGLMSSQSWHDDPKRLVFMLSRYKFVAKMLQGSGHVLEVGCADAFGSRIVRQEVEALTAVDFDPVFIDDAKGRIKIAECGAGLCEGSKLWSGRVAGGRRSHGVG